MNLSKLKEKASPSSIMGSTFKYVVVAFVLIVSLYPLLWVLLSSFKSNIEILTQPLALPESFNFDNYKLVFERSPITTYFKNSIIITFTSTFFNVFFLAMAAYVVARYEFKLKKVVVALFASTLFVPSIALTYPIYRMIKTLGLYDTKAGLSLVYMGLGIGMSFFILRSYMLSIPKEIEEAAFIEGASRTKVFFAIIIPLSKHGIITAAILAFLNNWNEFYYALLLTAGDNSRTVPVTVFNFMSMFRSNLGGIFASMVIIILPTIVVFFIASKQIIGSLVEGAVKD